MNVTRPLYLEDTYLFEAPATILQQADDEKGCYLLLDQTIFYPQGGGQPSDQGNIELSGRSLEISHVRQVEGEVRHYLKERLQESLMHQKIICRVDAEKRLLHARWHTAAHLLAHVVESLCPSLKATKGHSFPKEGYIECDNKELLQTLEVEKINAALCSALAMGLSVTSFEIDPLSFEQQFYQLTYSVAENKIFRAVQIGDYPPIPCGGTHVVDVSEIGEIELGKIKIKNDRLKISYAIK